MLTQVVLFIVAGLVLATADYFLFLFNPVIAFYLHSIFAFAVGLGLLLIAYKLKRRDFPHYATMLVGTGMMGIHLIKLLVGRCI
ncbi:hypothetical protein HY639_04785 [Candidatus Woesearchaeota archaeon]|nr:hypothetical protein [Candidatus Woesearchaeota archaeon]